MANTTKKPTKKPTKKTNTSSRTRTSTANKSNKTSTRKSPSNVKKTPYTTSSLHNREFYNEIFLVVGITMSLLLMLSSFDLIGKLGQFINTITFGLIGVSAYFLPFILFFSAFILVANHGNILAKKKLIYSLIFLCLISSFIQLFEYKKSMDSIKLSDYFNNSAADKAHGGMIGALITNIFRPFLGFWGTFITLAALIIIMIILISEKLIVSSVAKSSINALRNLKYDYQNSQYEYDDYDDYYYYEDDIANNPDIDRKPATTFNFSVEHTINEDTTENIQKPASKRSSTKRKSSQKIHSITLDTSTNGLSNPSSEDYEIDKETGEIYEKELKKKFSKKMTPVITDDLEVTNEDNSNDAVSKTPSKSKPKPRLHKSDSHDSHSSTNMTAINPEQVDGFSLTENYEQITPDDNISSITTNNNTENKSNSFQYNSTDSELDNTFDDVIDNHLRTNSNTISNKEINNNITNNLNEQKNVDSNVYQHPPITLLNKPSKSNTDDSGEDHYETAKKLEDTLGSFGVRVTVTDISVGPTVTRYEMQPEQGVKVSRITNLSDDIKLNLAATDIRIEAPIPGKAAVGIEVPNKNTSAVSFRELLESKEFTESGAKLAFAVGKDLAGKPVVTDIAKMPHLLIAGQTGSGKSVCINTLIMSILYKYHPDDVKMIMVDPKVVELSVYNGVPHLMIPVVTDPKKASQALNWAVAEMVDRYNKFAQLGVRDMAGFNKKIESVENSEEAGYVKMPQIVIVVDELADLMMVAPGEVEDAICRLAQMARAAGIHLVIATQRPSVNVITGLIKANVPSRIAFSVASAIDSRTILDGGGAEKLLGKGDMLFYPAGYPKPVRLQGAFVSDTEVTNVVEFLSANNSNTYSNEVIEKIETATATSVLNEGKNVSGTDSNDQYFAEAGKFIIEKEKASIGMLQRVYKIGFNRAARIMDQLAEAGVVGPEEGTKPRRILMTMSEFEQYLEGKREDQF